MMRGLAGPRPAAFVLVLLLVVMSAVVPVTAMGAGKERRHTYPLANDQVVDSVDLSEDADGDRNDAVTSEAIEDDDEGSGSNPGLTEASRAPAQLDEKTNSGGGDGGGGDDDTGSTFDDIDDNTNAASAVGVQTSNTNIQARCPASCNGRGQCMIVYPGAAQNTPYYACMCNKGYRGRGCEIDDLRTESGESGESRPTTDMPRYGPVPKGPHDQWPWPTYDHRNNHTLPGGINPVPTHLVANMPTETASYDKPTKKIESGTNPGAVVEISDSNFQCVHRCSGHGTCKRFTEEAVPNSKYWYCECEKPWSGVDCSVQYTIGMNFSPMSPVYKQPIPCHEHQCKHGGVVARDAKGCYCKCPPGWTGRQCEICNLQCHHGSVADTESCTCVCRNGWSGELCDTCDIKCKEGALFDASECACKCKLDNVHCDATTGPPNPVFAWTGSAGGAAGGRATIPSMGPLVDPELWGSQGFSIVVKIDVEVDDSLSRCVFADRNSVKGLRLCLKNDVWSLDSSQFPIGSLPSTALHGPHVLVFTCRYNKLRLFVDGQFRTEAVWNLGSGQYELGRGTVNIGFDQEHATATDWHGKISILEVFEGALAAPAVMSITEGIAANTTSDAVGPVVVDKGMTDDELEMLQLWENDRKDNGKEDGDKPGPGSFNVAEVTGGKCPVEHNGTCSCALYAYDEQCVDRTKCGLECLHGGQLNPKKDCECECTPPWNGRQCEACDRVCQNGGTLNGETCTCDCPNPWSGPDCTTCTPFCEHDGKANDLVRKAKLGKCACNCRPPWTGTQCEVCSAYCANGGTLDHDTCTCKCDWPWKGKECDECSLNCYHGSVLDEASCRCDKCPEPWGGRACNQCTLTCSKAELDPYKCTCRCDHPWAGEDCNVCKLQETDCTNGGILDVNKCECKCPPQWAGRLCDRCNLDCYNNGTFNMDNCKCECPKGYGGMQCQNCTRECFNGGMPNHACECVCPDGWGGESCLDCRRDCHNGGSLDSKTCTCTCATPWHGSTCNVCEAKCQNGRLNRDKCECECHNSWSGSSCESCELECKHGARRDDRACECDCPTTGGFWKGRDCDTCDFDFCFNGGWFNKQLCFCHCIYPWGGKQCNTCKLKCKNGGIIPYDQKDCKCVCPTKWTGVDCSIRVPALIVKPPEPVQDWPPEQVFMCGKSYACPYPTDGDHLIHPSKEKTSSEGAKGAPSPYSPKCTGGKHCGVGWFCWAGLPKPWKRPTRVGPGAGAGDGGGISVCPNECSHHGRCYNGTCLCVPSYSGDDCSQMCPDWTQKPPPIKSEYFGNVNVTGQPYFKPVPTNVERLSRADGQASAGMMDLSEKRKLPWQFRRDRIRRGKGKNYRAGLDTIHVTDADGMSALVVGPGIATTTAATPTSRVKQSLDQFADSHRDCHMLCNKPCDGGDGQDRSQCYFLCMQSCSASQAHYYKVGHRTGDWINDADHDHDE